MNGSQSNSSALRPPPPAGATPSSLRLLLVDDEIVIEKSIGRFLEQRGFAVTFARDATQALAAMQKSDFDLVVSDIKMPGLDGVDLVARIRDLSPETAVILMTGHADLETAIRAVRAGAADFLQKPVDLDRLLLSIEQAMRLRTLRRERALFLDRAQRAESETATRLFGATELVGESAAMKRARALIGRAAANSGITVLVTGETGTGKELAARLVHRLGPRADAPFIAVNCVALSPLLIESELFGHEKGAFTGADRRRRGLVETASEGTLFLDEIGDMTPELQGQLLRVIEERRVRPVGAEREVEVKTRFIAATNRNLDQAVAEGRFRADLFHRLNVFRIEMPSLRARRDDLALLARHFVADIAKRTGRPNPAIADAVLAAMQNYTFPGNVRELRNMIEQAMLLSDTDRLELELFPALTVFRNLGASGIAAAPPSPHDLASGERERIAKALTETGGNVKAAARLLGIGYDALRYRMRKFM